MDKINGIEVNLSIHFSLKIRQLNQERNKILESCMVKLHNCNQGCNYKLGKPVINLLTMGSGSLYGLRSEC